MKVIALFITLLYVTKPVIIEPVEIRKACDYINYDYRYKMFYEDSAGTKLYYNDITSFHVMGRWVMDCDLKVGSAPLFVGI